MTSTPRGLPENLSDAERLVARQAYGGLLWSKQFYHYVVEHWTEGDPVATQAAAQSPSNRAIRTGPICTAAT